MNYSVLMSVYYKDNPKYLREAIESMLNQTVKTNDFVIVKDGKLTDDLDQVIEDYVHKNPKLFNVIQLKENVGLGPAMNIGVTNCKNEWIARMDSDDVCLSDRCEKQLELAKKDPELSLIGSNADEFIDSIDNVICHVILPETDSEIKKFAKKRCPFRHPAVLFKKSMVLKAGNYRDYYHLEDYDLWIRMIQSGAKTYNLQKAYLFVRVSEDFYKRRGGIKYLKTILKFKREQYKNGFFL